MADITFNVDNMNLSKLKVSDLKRELRARGLNASGNKTELIERLSEAIQNGKNDDGSADSVDEILDEDDVLNDDEIEQEVDNMKSIELEVSEKSFETDSTTNGKSTKRKSFEVTNNNGTSDVKPAKKIVLNRTSSAELHTEENTDITPTAPTTTTPTTLVVAAAATINTESEKKVIKLSELSAKERLEMRAKKFGVALSADVKKEVRAQRFGSNNSTTSAATGRTTITINNSPTTGGPNMDLLKKRAERFGTVSTQLIKVEAQEKLEKRKARFGETTTTAPAAATNGDTSEVQKAKRLERFKATVK